MRPPAGDPGDATTADWPCRQIPTRATTRPGDELAPEAPPADPGARLVAVGPPTDQQRFQAAVVGPLLEQLLDPARALATGPLLLAEGGVVPPTARNARPLDVQAEPTHDRRP
ncbi:MAG TPA: hypothetical protein VMW49_03530, partial [Candidatus Dormibacteraeota bacterium]|nr:hypothetical protein [Candidatus Dormibacteraeota bacterium]